MQVGGEAQETIDVRASRSGKKNTRRCEHAFERAIVLWTLHATRMRRVELLGVAIVFGVEIDLADVSHHAHQRIGKASTESSCCGEGDELPGAIGHHHV